MAVRVQMVLLWAVSVGVACGCGLCRDDGRAGELVLPWVLGSAELPVWGSPRRLGGARRRFRLRRL